MDWERARKPEQKEIRRNAILEAAKALFSELKYEEISLNAIAREARISKPNVYRYFSSREEIFLAIFEEEQRKFIDELSLKLKRLRGKDIAAGIARAWVDVSLAFPTLMDLLPQHSISMEENSSPEQLAAFKKQTLADWQKLIGALYETHPAIDAEAWTNVIKLTVRLMSGLWPLANPSDVVVQAAKESGWQDYPWDFARLMKAGIIAFIHEAELGD